MAMPSDGLATISPLAIPLPPLPDGEVLTPAQWTTLMSIGDTIIPTIHHSSPASPYALQIERTRYQSILDNVQAKLSSDASTELAAAYIEEKASSTPGVKESIHRTLANYVRPEQRKGIAVILSALDTRPGCLLMTGSTTSFHLQPVDFRQRILQDWAHSYLPPLRAAATAFAFLFKATWLKCSPTLGPVLGFPRAPVHGKPGKGFDYSFIQFPPGDEPEVVETDVVIIGSGCGAGVSAKNLAEDGYRVVVVEKAYHYPPEYLPMSETDAGVHLFANGGNEGADDASIFVVSSSAFGGGGTINWSASLQLQGAVRQEWSEAGLPFFTSSDFQTCLDRVCARMGVSADHIEHNKTNRVLLDGSRKLGYSCKAVPQNTGGVKHYDGYCTLGCGAHEKQGPAVSFLPDAEKAGAKFIEGFHADKIAFETINKSKRVTGLHGTWTSRDSNGGVSGKDRVQREVFIKAKRVIVSCGTLQSPLLLLRSGLSNSHIGRNLHLHPANLVGATFAERTNPWEGGILTTVVDSFQDLDTFFHGAKIEASTMIPSMFLPMQPWISGADWKSFVADFSHMTGYISLVRDRDAGRVYPDPVDGRCRIAYTPSPFDKKHCLVGLIALAKILYVAGASKIHMSTSGIPAFRSKHTDTSGSEPSINDEEFQAWLSLITQKGLPKGEVNFASAHQMGTCRMGKSEKEGVVNGKGKVWETEGLYVADASVFPSASGVNPMVTTMATADWISRNIGIELRAGKGT